MSYTIDERNPERQQLLAELLNPTTRQVLARLPAIPHARVLDLGCGQGNTTRLLADALRPAECVGVDYDPALVDYASAHPDNPTVVRFEQGDATRLAFADGAFDVAFCRYLLIHMTDPDRVVREMLRVVRPGGYVIAYEADLVVEVSDPPCAALASINKVWQGLFQNPSGGRKLVRYFRGAGAAGIDAGAIVQLEHDCTTIKRIYRLTAEATGPLAQSRGVLTAGEVEDMIAGLTRLEEDASNVLMKFPDMWVIATREAAGA